MPDPNSKNYEDTTTIRSQDPKSDISEDMDKVQRLDGGGLERI